jgi:hypothetical protein
LNSPALVGKKQRRRASAPKLKVKPVALFALLAQWRCLWFEFSGIGGRNTAEARKRPEIESYIRSVLRISCEIALFVV